MNQFKANPIPLVADVPEEYRPMFVQNLLKMAAEKTCRPGGRKLTLRQRALGSISQVTFVSAAGMVAQPPEVTALQGSPVYVYGVPGRGFMAVDVIQRRHTEKMPLAKAIAAAKQQNYLYTMEHLKEIKKDGRTQHPKAPAAEGSGQGDPGVPGAEGEPPGA